jgi:hypothetical protein
VGLPVGPDGGYYVGTMRPTLECGIRNATGPELGIGAQGFHGIAGQQETPDIVIEWAPPAGQPGQWCQWTPDEDGTAIVWDEGEKFYEYVDWICYLIDQFLKPWGYVVNGEVTWSGEESGDLGLIEVTDNKVRVKYGHIEYD